LFYFDQCAAADVWAAGVVVAELMCGIEQGIFFSAAKDLTALVELSCIFGPEQVEQTARQIALKGTENKGNIVPSPSRSCSSSWQFVFLIISLSLFQLIRLVVYLHTLPSPRSGFFLPDLPESGRACEIDFSSFISPGNGQPVATGPDSDRKERKRAAVAALTPIGLLDILSRHVFFCFFFHSAGFFHFGVTYHMLASKYKY
jgi:hypothetical protein